MFTGSAGAATWGALFTCELAAACVMDIRLRRIPNVLVLLILGSGLAFSLISRTLVPGLATSAAGVGLGFAIWIVFYVIGALGAGDVKFFAAIGSWLGPALTWRAALVAAVIGGVLATAFLLWERRLAKTLQRIALAVSFRNPHLVEAPAPNARPHAKLPYGVALASGAFIAAWWPHLLG